MQLAQLNIGTLKAPIDDPATAEFKDNLDRINALAEASPGFVWRMKDDSNNATGIETPWPGDMIANLSVWTDLESLRLYVYKSAHAPFIRRRQEWFRNSPDRHMVLWWIEDGHRPDLFEAKARLETLQRQGPGPDAFLFSKAFSVDGQPVDRHGRLKSA